VADGKVLQLVSGGPRSRVGDGLRAIAELADAGRVEGAVVFFPLDEDFSVRLLGTLRLCNLMEAYKRFELHHLLQMMENDDASG
jgi:hypothetical protein